MPTGSPVVTSDPSGNHDYVFTWNGSIAANPFQAQKGAQDLIAQQISSGNIDSSSGITTNPDGSFTLTINKSEAFITVTVQTNVTLAVSATSPSVTNFNLMNGTVDAGGLASQSQVQQQLTTFVGQWEQQAQKEPPQAPATGFAPLDL